MRKTKRQSLLKLRKDQALYNVKKANKACENNAQLIKDGYLPVIPAFISPFGEFEITDKRDIKEFNRRIKKNKCQPLRDELYSVNSNFNGVYSDPQNR